MHRSRECFDAAHPRRAALFGRSPGRSSRAAFSLAEVMIALVILGLGLLFIAAALPVGVDYSRQSLDLSTADGAGRFAASVVSGALRVDDRLISNQAYNAGLPSVRQEGIHRPRIAIANPSWPPPNPGFAAGAAAPTLLLPRFEPFIKVRPLSMGNIDPQQLNGAAGESGHVIEASELLIFNYIAALSGAIPSLSPASTNPTYPVALYDIDFGVGAPDRIKLAFNPLVSGTDRFFPPIGPNRPFSAADFFATGGLGANDYRRYTGRMAGANMVGITRREASKARDSRIAWTAFYRRANSDRISGPGPDNLLGTPDDLRESDPYTYEVVIVVTRRPSSGHRYAQQDWAAGVQMAPFVSPRARYSGVANPPADDFGWDRLAPSPWLVVFSAAAVGTGPNSPVPVLRGGTVPFSANVDYALTPPPGVLISDRPVNPNPNVQSLLRKPTMTFLTGEDVGHLLPVGSIFIPAANDHLTNYNDANPATPALEGSRNRIAGFVPHDPDALPIYTVVANEEVNGTHRISVETNGSFPWLADPSAVAGVSAAAWPVWVIPPSFSSRTPNGQPIFERGNPVVAVVRRMIRLPEARP